MEDTTDFSAVHDKKREYYFNEFRYLFKLIGVSLDSNRSMAYKIYSFVLIFTTLFLSPFLRILELVLRRNMPIDYDAFLYPYGTTMIFAKSMVFLRNRAKLAKLLDKLEQEPFLPDPSRGNKVEEENLHKNCMRIIKTQSIIYIGATIFIITLLATEPLVKRIISSDYHDWEFPYGQTTLVNVTHSPNYELWWFYENFSVYLFGAYFVSTDTIVTAVLMYVGFQFKILQSNIRHIVEISYNDMLKETGNCKYSSETSIVDASMVPWKYLKKSLTKAVDYHLAILSVAAETEAVFNGMLLFSFLNALGLLGVLGSHASNVTMGGVFVVCGQLILSCFWGEQLMHEGHEVGRAAFESNFIGADIRFQKSIALIIRRSQNPVALTAAKFTVVGLSSFIWIVRAGYSTAAVLRQLQ